jgi:hypothetical protein
MRRLTLFLLITVWSGTSMGGQDPTPSAIDPKADAVLKRMGQALAGAKSFTFDSHAITQHVLEDGQKVEFARSSKFAIRRPNRVAADVVGDVEELSFRYDGKTVTLYNKQTNSYGACEAKENIDATCDLLAGKYGMVLPLADLLFEDAYKTLTSAVRSGRHLGSGYVFDVKCHHLAFRQEAVDWQIWVDEGERPLPRKLVITYKETPAQLQFTAYLNNWNVSADLPDDRFTFKAPADAKKIDFAKPVIDRPGQP